MARAKRAGSVEGPKLIGGRVYRTYGSWTTKKEATRHATHLRTKGFAARIKRDRRLPESMRPPAHAHTNVYTVYISR